MWRPVPTILLTAALVGLAAGAWWYFKGSAAASQLASYRIGQAATFEQAKREIAAIERQPNRDDALRELMSGWRTGNSSFDLYLATYASEPESSEALRRAFSWELSWRPELLTDWAHFWSWRTKLSPPDEIASIADYLEAMSKAESARPLTWREVLDLQAAFTLTGRADLARRLAPDNWAERYRAWRKDNPDFSQVSRPAKPLPDR